MVSKTWIYQNIFGFNKETIEQIHTDLLREKLEAAEIESAGAAEEGGDEGGDDAGGDGGGLFDGDVATGQILDAGTNDTKIIPQLGESDATDDWDDEDDEVEDDEEFINLDKISSEYRRRFNIKALSWPQRCLW